MIALLFTCSYLKKHTFAPTRKMCVYASFAVVVNIILPNKYFYQNHLEPRTIKIYIHITYI